MTDREPPEIIQISLGEMRFVPAPAPKPEHEPEPAPATPPPSRRISLKWITDALVAIRTGILSRLLLVPVVGLVAFAVAELRRDIVVIDPIRLPDALRKMGYSEDVAAYRLWDEVVRINESTPTAKDRVTLLPSSQKMDFEAPGAGISMQGLVQMLRPFFGLSETRITGDFICATTACAPEGLALRLRVCSANGMKIISLPPIGKKESADDIGAYFSDAVLEVLREIDPYVVAFYLYQTDPAAAEREAPILNAPGHPQQKWALNLLGFTATNEGDHDTAIGWYKRAIEVDERFAIAHKN